jgi:hypothetical protein
MTDVTRILSAIEQGDPRAAEQLLPLVYDELRTLAARRLSQEKPGQTLQATALVREAYLRLVDTDEAQQWNSRGHFFAAAAEAMRRILVERARHKRSLKAGGDRGRQELPDIEMAVAGAPFVPEPSRERFMQVTWRGLDRSSRRGRTGDGQGFTLTGGPRGHRMGGVSVARPDESPKPAGLVR